MVMQKYISIKHGIEAIDVGKLSLSLTVSGSSKMWRTDMKDRHQGHSSVSMLRIPNHYNIMKINLWSAETVSGSLCCFLFFLSVHEQILRIYFNILVSIEHWSNIHLGQKVKHTGSFNTNRTTQDIPESRHKKQTRTPWGLDWEPQGFLLLEQT